MAKLIYATPTSLDGYIADDGNLEWAAPEVIPGLKPFMRDFARIWQEADKIVYSGSPESVARPKTRLEREFDARAVRDLKAQPQHEVSVGGPTPYTQPSPCSTD